MAEPLEGLALHPDAPPRDLLELCIELWQDSVRVNAPKFRQQKEELDFALKHQHYVNERSGTKDQRSLQPHTTHLFHVQRHKCSEAASQRVYIECRPQHPQQGDPGQSELAKLALEETLYDPRRMYTRLRRRWIIGAVNAREWVMAIDYDHGLGSVSFRLVPPWLFHQAAGWQEMHEQSCPWVCEESDPTLREIRANGRLGWKNTELVKSDGEIAAEESGQRPNPELQPSAQDTAKLLKFWFRQDEATVQQTVNYLECPDCQARYSGDADGIEQMCPACMDGLGAWNAPYLVPRQEVTQSPRYPHGRLVIVAPRSRVVLYDDEWPCEMPTFPYMLLRDYEHPIDRSGLSEPALHWDNVLLLNLTKRYGWDQLRRGAGLFVFPDKGLFNAQRQPFQYSDLHGQIAYADSPQAASAIHYFPGAVLNPGVVTLHELIANDFQQGSGIADLALGEEDTKDIPVGTVKTLERLGNVPTRDFVEILREEESIGFAVVLAMLIHSGQRLVARQLVREGPAAGTYQPTEIDLSQLSPQDVTVHAAPSFTELKADEMENFLRFSQLFQSAPGVALRVAQDLNYPLSWIRDVMRAAPPLPLALPPGEGAPGGAGLPDPLAQRLGMMGGPSPDNGMNGGANYGG